MEIFKKKKKEKKVNVIEAIENCKYYIVKSILDKNISELNIKNEDGDYPLLITCSENSVEMALILIDYADKNSIKLELNESNNHGFYPSLNVCIENSITMIQLLINYGNKNNIILELNRKNNIGNYPLLLICDNNNIEMF